MAADFLFAWARSMGQCKKDVTPLLTNRSYALLALTHGDHQQAKRCQYIINRGVAPHVPITKVHLTTCISHAVLQVSYCMGRLKKNSKPDSFMAKWQCVFIFVDIVKTPWYIPVNWYHHSRVQMICCIITHTPSKISEVILKRSSNVD